MRKIIICTTLIIMSCQIFGQETHDKTYYLAKSKNQKNTGWIFAIGGVVIAGAAGLIASQSICFTCPKPTGPDASTVVAIIGGVTTLSSIPFFISSANNKKKANNLSVFFRLDHIPFAIPGAFGRVSSPTALLRIRL